MSGFHIICTCRLSIVKVEQVWIEFWKQWFNNNINHKCELTFIKIRLVGHGPKTSGFLFLKMFYSQKWKVFQSKNKCSGPKFNKSCKKQRTSQTLFEMETNTHSNHWHNFSLWWIFAIWSFFSKIIYFIIFSFSKEITKNRLKFLKTCHVSTHCWASSHNIERLI